MMYRAVDVLEEDYETRMQGMVIQRGNGAIRMCGVQGVTVRYSGRWYWYNVRQGPT